MSESCRRLGQQNQQHDDKQPFDVNDCDASVTLLQQAIRNSEGSVIRHLLKFRGHVDELDVNGQSSLHYAWNAQQEMQLIHDLLEAGVDVNVACHSLGNTVLHKTGAPLEYYRAVLRSDRCDVINGRNNEGNTPLHAAINALRYDVVRELLAFDADASIQNNAGNTPLHVALKERYRKTDFALGGLFYASAGITEDFFAMVTSLLSHDADAATRQNCDGDTVLHLAVTSTCYAKAVLASCDWFDATNKANSRGDTALHNAMRSGSDEVVTSLLSHGADPTVQNTSGETVLHVTSPSTVRIQAILQDGRCDVNVRNASGMMALHGLCEDHYYYPCIDNCIFLLIKRGAILNTSQELMSRAFCRYLESNPRESLPAFRLILLASAGARLDVVFKSDEDKEMLLRSHLSRRYVSRYGLQQLRPLLSQIGVAKKEIKALVRNAEEREQIVEMFSSPISLQERCLQVVRVECRPNALAAAHHLPLPQALICRISPYVNCTTFADALAVNRGRHRSC